MTTKTKTNADTADKPEETESAALVNALYTERAHLIALLARDYPSAYKESTDDEGWITVYVDLPTGQASWHIAPEDQHLFAGVRFAPDIDWDGHTTEEKYARIRTLIGREQ